MQLFSDRATAAKHDFVLTERNAGTIGVLCRRLDGIPLAIELAAARARSMAPEDLVARLDQRFKLLTGGSRAALERHQTLRSTIDWSYDLLEATEQKALDRLSVFAGGCDLAAAEAVLADDDLDGLDVVDALGHLVDKSLVIADADAAGGVRYRLLESIRQYGRERLEASGETAGSVVATPITTSRSPRPLARTCGRRTRSRGPPALARDTDNFRVVLDWAIETASPEHACRMIAPFTVQGLPIAYTAMDWAQTAVAIPGGEDQPLFVMVAAWAAWGATMANDLDRAADFIAAAERAQGGSGETSQALLRARAVAAYFGGDTESAIKDTEAWVALARASEDHYELSDALVVLGSARSLAEPEVGLALLREAVRAARAAGIPSSLGDQPRRRGWEPSDRGVGTGARDARRGHRGRHRARGPHGRDDRDPDEGHHRGTER